jgi:hypothetical protein
LIEERQESCTVKDAKGQQIAYFYFDEPQRQMSMKRLSRGWGIPFGCEHCQLQSVLRQTLKDIPRPPNSASRDDWSPKRRGRLPLKREPAVC